MPLKGWKTLIVGLLLATVPAASQYLGMVDWNALGLDPKWSGAIGVFIMMMRAMTSTPPFKATTLAIGLLAITAAALLAPTHAFALERALAPDHARRVAFDLGVAFLCVGVVGLAIMGWRIGKSLAAWAYFRRGRETRLNSPWFVAPLALSLLCAACANLTPAQQNNLQLQLDLAKQIGSDAVQIWCAASGVIYVIANDADAKSRVAAVLGKNASAATDACPMIASITGVKVGTAAQAAAGTLATAATSVAGS